MWLLTGQSEQLVLTGGGVIHILSQSADIERLEISYEKPQSSGPVILELDNILERQVQARHVYHFDETKCFRASVRFVLARMCCPF